MAVPAENLDWSCWSHGSDLLLNEAKSVGVVSGSDRVVANEEEQIDWLGVVDGIQEPLLLHHGRCLDDLGDIGVSSEVIQDAKCHDAKTCWEEVSVSGNEGENVSLPCAVVKYLY